jgi:hypothetical protein
MPLPSMHQEHQHIITRYVHVPYRVSNMYHASTMHHPVPQHVPSVMYQHCTSTMYIKTIPCTNHVHQPCASTPYHVPTMYHEMCINHIPRICAKCVPRMYIDHQQVPHTYTKNLKQCAQYPTCSSNHVPQPFTISLMACLNHAMNHNIINM